MKINQSNQDVSTSDEAKFIEKYSPPISEEGIMMCNAHMYYKQASSDQRIWALMEKFYSSMIVDITDIVIPNNVILIKIEKMARFRVLWIKTSSVIYKKKVQTSKSQSWVLYLIEKDKKIIYYIEISASDYQTNDNKGKDKKNDNLITEVVDHSSKSLIKNDVDIILPELPNK